MLIRSPGFCFSNNNIHTNNDWRRDFSLEELKNKYQDWDFKEMPTAYRFINPEKTLVKYYKFDGNFLQIPLNQIYFDVDKDIQ